MSRLAALLLCALVCGAIACSREPRLRHVVLVSLDAVGARHVGAYGYPRDTTPVLDAVARDGTLFEAAYTQQPWTLSSHLTLLTGLHPAVHGASRTRPVSPAAETIAERLRAEGLETAAFVAERVWMHPRYGHARGFDRYEVGESDARENAPAIVAWLGEQARAVAGDPEHRFFLFAHFYDAHSDGDAPLPYSVPPPTRDRYLPDEEPWGRSGGTALLLQLRRSGSATPRDRDFVRAYYDAGVRYVDAYGLGAIVTALDELGLARDTLLVVTADHGEELFEHGYVLHGQPYDETIRVPLVLRGPGIPRGQRVPHLAGLVDLAPTLLSLLGLPSLAGAQGVDLSSLLRGGGPIHDAVFTDGVYEGEPGWGSSVVADLEGRRWSYLAKVAAERRGGKRTYAAEADGELYDLGADPLQQRDVGAMHPQIARRLRARLLGWYRANELRARQLGVAPESSPPSDDETEHLRALGYAE